MGAGWGSRCGSQVGSQLRSQVWETPLRAASEDPVPESPLPRGRRTEHSSGCFGKHWSLNAWGLPVRAAGANSETPSTEPQHWALDPRAARGVGSWAPATWVWVTRSLRFPAAP